MGVVYNCLLHARRKRETRAGEKCFQKESLAQGRQDD